MHDIVFFLGVGWEWGFVHLPDDLRLGDAVSMTLEGDRGARGVELG